MERINFNDCGPSRFGAGNNPGAAVARVRTNKPSDAEADSRRREYCDYEITRGVHLNFLSGTSSQGLRRARFL